MNTSRTHTSNELAFRNHCDYSCAVTVYQGWFARFCARFRKSAK